jgi:hypothetical protein
MCPPVSALRLRAHDGMRRMTVPTGRSIILADAPIAEAAGAAHEYYSKPPIPGHFLASRFFAGISA